MSYSVFCYSSKERWGDIKNAVREVNQELYIAHLQLISESADLPCFAWILDWLGRTKQMHYCDIYIANVRLMLY